MTRVLKPKCGNVLFEAANRCFFSGVLEYDNIYVGCTNRFALTSVRHDGSRGVRLEERLEEAFRDTQLSQNNNPSN